MPLTTIFVYGTLKRGQLRERMWPCRPLSVSEAIVRGVLYDLGPYPALLPPDDDSPGKRIGGEVWSFDIDHMPEVLRVLDRIEGYNQPGEPSLYIRVAIAYETIAGEAGTAFGYHFANRTKLLREARRVAPGPNGVCRWPEK